MKMFVGEDWVEGTSTTEVTSPFDGSVIDTVPRATVEDVEIALAAAVGGAHRMRHTSGYDRFLMLNRAAELVGQRTEELARTITLEEGKTIRESRIEIARSQQTLMLSAEEAKRITGEVVPLDGAVGSADRIGFTLRIPCGVVVAITPFNFPLNLVVHKVGPALAAGNSVIIKPASDTPLSALKLTEILLEAGVPPTAIQCLTGAGGLVGRVLCSDSRVRKISFTGSRDVGEQICHTAGLKKVTMELGSNSPLIIMPDADLEKAASAISATGYGNAGQVCISTQRVLALRPIYHDLLQILKPKVESIVTGNPLEEGTGMGPLIREQEAVRVENWLNEAVEGGAKLVTGGKREKALLSPAIVAGVSPRARIFQDELFGPAVAVTSAESIEEAISMSNDSKYGLAAGIFTRNLDWAMKFIKEVDAGNLHVNWGPQWRADLMPYGGLKESGFGKEGPHYAILEMTELKMVILHP
jgi:acyl-CoA reductase-like NAD-dependent aldehyde dehydrogenase